MKTEQEILFERDRMRLNQSGLAPQETLITKMMKEKHGPDWWRDDRVWLAYATAHYVESIGDFAILEEPIFFLDGPMLSAAEHDAWACR